MSDLWPAIAVFFVAYVTARVLNYRDYKKVKQEYEKQELARRNKIDALYGREK